MNLFTWSIPFVMEKVSEVLYHLMKPDAKYDEVELPVEIVFHKQIL